MRINIQFIRAFLHVGCYEETIVCGMYNLHIEIVFYASFLIFEMDSHALSSQLTTDEWLLAFLYH